MPKGDTQPGLRTQKSPKINQKKYFEIKKSNLSGANLSEVVIRYANLDGATLCNTKTPWGVDNSGCKDFDVKSEDVKTNALKLKALKHCDNCI